MERFRGGLVCKAHSRLENNDEEEEEEAESDLAAHSGVARAPGHVDDHQLRPLSQKVSITSIYKSQLLHKPVNLVFISVIMKDKLTDLWEN